MKLSELIWIKLNKIFPSREKLYRESPERYIRIQYDWARISLSYFKELINLEGKNILDAGCSLGGKTLYFSELNPSSVVGVDIDPIRINYAQEYFKNNEKIGFKVANLAKLPFEDGSFDLIFMNDVVEHININLLKKVFAECKRVLKSSGKICLEFPPWESPDASHLYDYINIPWCQILISDQTLISIVNQLPQVSTFGHQDSIEHYMELNRITIPMFEKYINECKLKIFYRNRRMIKNINILRYIPFLNKYFTTRAIYILEK